MNARLRHLLPHGLMLAASVLLYWAATQIDVGSAGNGRIGPDAWPKAIIVFMGLLCAWELVRRIARGAVAPGVEHAEEPGGAGTAKRLQPARLAGGAALVVGYVLAVPHLGFFVTTALFLAGFAWVGGTRRPGIVAAVALAGSLAMVVMFMRVAYVSLPLGEGPFRDFSMLLLRLVGVS